MTYRTTTPEATNNPVTVTTLLLICLSLLAVLLAMSGAAAYWITKETQARFLLRDQSGWIKFPEALNVKAQINNAMQVQVNQTIDTQVPIRQAIDIPVPGDIQAYVTIDTSVPLSLNVAINDTLAIDQIIPIDTKVDIMIAGVAVSVPIKGDVPIKANIPLNLQVPINDDVPLKFTSPVTIRLKEPLHAELDTVLDTTIPIKGVLELPVTSQIEASLNFPPEPVEAGLYYLDMNLPLRNIEFSMSDSKNR